MSTINLSEKYYLESKNFPQIIKAVGEAMREWMAGVFYGEEDLEDALDRIMIADIGGSEESAIRQATSDFGTNQNYPFTAYNFGEYETVLERRNNNASSTLAYSSALDSLVSAVPIKQEFLAITFTNNPNDEERVKKILFEQSYNFTMLYAPVTLNGVEYDYPVKIEFIPSKGNYSFAFSEYLRVNKIFDVSHNFNLFFYDLILDTDTFPIDEMTANLEEKSPIDDDLNSTVGSKDYVKTDMPEISVSDPVNEAVDVPVENSIILTFNVTMDESYVNGAYTLDPYFEHDRLWDEDSKILILNPKENLTSGTLYTIEIDDTARAFYVHDVIDEYELTFTTEE